MIGIQISLNSWYSCLVGICLCQPGKRWAVAAIFSCDMVYMCDCWKILDWRVYIYMHDIYLQTDMTMTLIYRRMVCHPTLSIHYTKYWHLAGCRLSHRFLNDLRYCCNRTTENGCTCLLGENGACVAVPKWKMEEQYSADALIAYIGCSNVLHAFGLWSRLWIVLCTGSTEFLDHKTKDSVGDDERARPASAQQAKMIPFLRMPLMIAYRPLQQTWLFTEFL